MAEPSLSEIRLIELCLCPQGLGALQRAKPPLISPQALFSPGDTTFGGDGQVSFALPDRAYPSLPLTEGLMPAKVSKVSPLRRGRFRGGRGQKAPQ